MTDNQTKTNSKKIAIQKKELQELQELSLDEMQRVMGGESVHTLINQLMIAAEISLDFRDLAYLRGIRLRDL